MEMHIRSTGKIILEKDPVSIAVIDRHNIGFAIVCHG